MKLAESETGARRFERQEPLTFATSSRTVRKRFHRIRVALYGIFIADAIAFGSITVAAIAD